MILEELVGHLVVLELPHRLLGLLQLLAGVPGLRVQVQVHCDDVMICVGELLHPASLHPGAALVTLALLGLEVSTTSSSSVL